MINRKCDDCKKQIVVKYKSKKLCSTCYSRAYRKTESGKAAIKKYNDSEHAHKARERFRLKNKGPKKIYKKICDCGKIAKAKGMCMSCYQKDRYKPKHGKAGRPKVKGNQGVEASLFNRVCDLIKEGIPFYKACKYENISRDTFMRHATEAQKLKLNDCRRTKDLRFRTYE